MSDGSIDATPIDRDSRSNKAEFRTTRWTIVRGLDDREDRRREALSDLAEHYWYPLYAWLRRRGEDGESAAELVQEFFLSLLEPGAFARLDPEKGRFRSWLLKALEHHASNVRTAARAQKRLPEGGVLSLDAVAANERFRKDSTGHQDPHRVFDRQWALSLLDEARGALRAEWRKAGREVLYDRLERSLVDQNRFEGAASLAEELGIGESALRVQIHRLRRRYGEIVREMVRDTVEDEADVDIELEHLLRSL